MPGGPRGLQNRWEAVKPSPVCSIRTLSAIACKPCIQFVCRCLRFKTSFIFRKYQLPNFRKQLPFYCKLAHTLNLCLFRYEKTGEKN